MTGRTGCGGKGEWSGRGEQLDQQGGALGEGTDLQVQHRAIRMQVEVEVRIVLTPRR
ncbi:hypothetical protein [Saccharomonospora sp.]|uniref:hypothetical protein n=1 Tax=Saccharomonospora sp. TaxID=33913 RepID=UPI002616311E|nr:hypothetical protein [Saccharomonospora sp.]